MPGLRAALSSFACAAALASCASPRVTASESEPVTLSLAPRLSPVVEASSGRGEFPALLDTGAARTLIDRELARELGMSLAWRPWPTFLHNEQDWMTVWHVARVERLELGAASVEDLSMCPVDLDALFAGAAPIGAIVGQDVLSRVALVLDNERREAELVASEGVRAALDRRWPDCWWSVLPLRYERGCPRVELDLGLESKVSFLIDTGAEISSLPHAVVRRLELLSAGEGSVGVRIGGPLKMQLFFLDDLPFGDWRIDLVAGEIPVDYGMLGMDVLSRVPLAIDGPARKLWIGAPRDGRTAHVSTALAQFFGSRKADAKRSAEAR